MDQLELLVAQLMIGYKRIANPSFNESCGPSLTYFTLSAVRTSVSFLLLLRQLARPVESSGLDETLTIGLSNSGE